MFFTCPYWALIYSYCNDLRVGNFMASRHEDRQGHLIFLMMSRDGKDRPCCAYGCVNLLNTEHTWECHVISHHQWGTIPSLHYLERIVHFVGVREKTVMSNAWKQEKPAFSSGKRTLKRTLIDWRHRMNVNEMSHKSDL